MKIGLLTIHHSYNYGAILQTFATIEILKKLGCDVEIIDFDNDSFIERRNIILKYNSISNILRNLRNLLSFHKLKRRITHFESFYKNLPIGKIHFINKLDTKKLDYDCIIVGSDQTFSLHLTNNPEEMKPFFLPGIVKTRKISYASSMGEKNQLLTQKEIEWMKERWEEFDFLSVREQSAKDFIARNTNLEPSIVLDPTLLLSCEEWELVSSSQNIFKGDYIVFYTVLSSPEVIKLMKDIRESTNLHVIALHPKTRFEFNMPFDYKIESGPSEFITFIKNAKYVITTSFHATVFSIIYHKQFLSIKQGEGNRLKSLLYALDIPERFINPTQKLEMSLLDEPINFNKADKNLKTLKEISFDFLSRALHDEKKRINQ